jgi:hypothetical protein
LTGVTGKRKDVFESSEFLFGGVLALTLLVMALILWPRKMNLPPRDITSHRNGQARHWGDY